MNAYHELLKALGGDTYENRRLINDFAHHLARVVGEVVMLGANGGQAAMLIDPYFPEKPKGEWKKVVNMGDAEPDWQKSRMHSDLEKGWNE